MATGTQPDAGQILNSLINSILLVDDDLAVHFANPAAQQLLAQSSRKLFGTVTGTVELLLIKYRADARKSGGGARFYR